MFGKIITGAKLHNQFKIKETKNESERFYKRDKK